MGSKLETEGLTQPAVLWPINGTGNYGEKVGAPVQIMVRWESVRSRKDSGQTDSELVVAKVFIDQEILLGSLLWKGKQEELPANPKNLVRVKEYKEVPDDKGRHVRRWVMCTGAADYVPAK